MNEIARTGGARIGWVNATWPFAKLTVTDQTLKLNVSFIGKYEFHKGDIIRITKYGLIPILASGIKIEHNIVSYPKSIIFWTLSSPKKLIASIEQTGILTEVPETNAQPIQRTNGFPVKIFPIIAIIVIWNLLFLADQNFLLSQAPNKPGIYSAIAMIFTLVTTLAIKSNTKIAKIILKPERSVGEIMPMLNLFILVTGLLSIMFTLFLVLDAFK